MLDAGCWVLDVELAAPFQVSGFILQPSPLHESALQGNWRRVKMLPLKRKVSSAVGSCSDNPPKWVDMQICIIT